MGLDKTNILEMPLEDITKIARKHGDKLKNIAKELNISDKKLKYILYYNYYTKKPYLKEIYRNIALAIHRGRYYYNIDKTLNQ